MDTQLVATQMRHRTWMEDYARQQESGLTVKQWCKENGIIPKAFYYRLRVLREEACSIMEDTVAYPVAQRAKEAADKFNRDARRNSLIHTAITEQSGCTYSVRMGLDNEDTTLLGLELMAPSISQARRLERTFRKKAEKIYQLVMSEFLAKPEKEE